MPVPQQTRRRVRCHGSSQKINGGTGPDRTLLAALLRRRKLLHKPKGQRHLAESAWGDR
jgi:hypothetical protein